ncbi:bifunctional diguanylate cyclase/phosphodiesterase [Halomonas sp. A11-A]|uniref:putative bifunctional diguanylate cyclase/phosphodiesterase n=1 Tax=Halomonas sp. A11-A TaxID=2183985 RepID=UPI000D70BD73|nr:GGDEF domain-containing protein [Halomonas sp. A11-A]PWV78252.1 PAS domain S-box-containing protein/diguanylate cyclase (GGDEF)-like protein [Halomonas sp. A11-A]
MNSFSSINPLAFPARYAESGFQHADEAILVTDKHHCIVAANPRFMELTGKPLDALIGETLEAAGLEGRWHIDRPRFLAELENGGRARAEVHWRDARGHERPGLLSARRVREPSREPYQVLVLTDLACLAVPGGVPSSTREVYFDSLTGLPNQQLVTQLIEESIRHARHSDGQLAVCALDIDHFKHHNDQLGRQLGDLLLATFAKRITHLMGGDDVVARVGGDEFVLLLHGVSGDALYQQLLEAIEKPLVLQGHSVRLTASLGVTCFPDDSVEGDVLLRHATQAMYRAKQRGRNTFHRFDPNQDRELQVRQERRTRLAEGLELGELRLHYQPQVDLFDGSVVGVEALVRWQHPEDGLLAPGAFLSVVTGSHLEQELGEWVLEAALKQITEWQGIGIDLPVHVNISPPHLLSDTFVAGLEALLARYPNVSPSRLKLEILESTAIHDVQQALATMRRCQAMGIDFAIDDFGTGFSSLTHLRQLPVDLIKIDQSFVRDMLSDPDDLAIVESVIFMANRFKRPMLAEGVETLAHARALVKLGCCLAQGYGIARPMPADALPDWLAEWPHRHEWRVLSMQMSASG